MKELVYIGVLPLHNINGLILHVCKTWYNKLQLIISRMGLVLWLVGHKKTAISCLHSTLVHDSHSWLELRAYSCNNTWHWVERRYKATVLSSRLRHSSVVPTVLPFASLAGSFATTEILCTIETCLRHGRDNRLLFLMPQVRKHQQFLLQLFDCWSVQQMSSL